MDVTENFSHTNIRCWKRKEEEKKTEVKTEMKKIAKEK